MCFCVQGPQEEEQGAVEEPSEESQVTLTQTVTPAHCNHQLSLCLSVRLSLCVCLFVFFCLPHSLSLSRALSVPLSLSVGGVVDIRCFFFPPEGRKTRGGSAAGTGTSTRRPRRGAATTRSGPRAGPDQPRWQHNTSHHVIDGK